MSRLGHAVVGEDDVNSYQVYKYLTEHLARLRPSAFSWRMGRTNSPGCLSSAQFKLSLVEFHVSLDT